ncbi:MAG TPA: thiamine pyrophosphate-dependent enzyme [Candidatus Krumholzibacteria bacterium]|nr:thiamine pyrophosphate-dependent enzyme [Candidatus Krumholzibacteria bacterium]
MTDPTTIATLADYRNDTPYPFCPGCGHHSILDQLAHALASLQLDPKKVVLVSDIGCSGLSDQYFSTSAFHGLHGRSLTYATGVKLARPDLTVIVIMGDGGTGIGGAHLLNAARRNIGLTVLVFNNFNFGMTGGQHSTTTPPGAITSTTPDGNLERPLDVCATVAANGAGYVWRGTSFDHDLSERIAEAIRSECFALLDIWELCTAYYVPKNKASKKTLTQLLDQLQLKAGLLQRAEHPEYAAAYHNAAGALRGKPLLAPQPLESRFESVLQNPFHLVIAGSAGAKVRSAARLVGEAAVLSGLWAAQRDDYPITVKTGHSVAELVLSPREIHYSGISRPDALIVLSREGLAKVGARLAAMEAGDRVFTTPGLVDAVMTRATITVVDPRAAPAKLAPGQVSLYCVARALHELGIFPADALEAAAVRGGTQRAQENTATIRMACA